MEFKNEGLIKAIPLEASSINGSLETISASNNDGTNSLEVDYKESCEKSDIPLLLKLFQDVHSQRLLTIENNRNLNDCEKTEEKILALQSYIQQLLEQNDTFASTMIELEKEAQQRVKQMEKRLKSSAKTTMEAVINMHECEKEMRRLVEERLYIESLYKNAQQDLSSIKVENGFLRDQNFNLNHDIQALLHVIHHARSTGHWEMDCVTFCEVTPEQVFGPVQSLSHIYSADSDSQLFDREDRKLSANSSQDAASTCTSTPSHRHTIPKNKTHFSSIPPTSYLPRCVSLPEIGNIYSYTQVMRKSNSYETNSNNRILSVKLSETNNNTMRKNQDTPELLRGVNIENLEQRLCVRKGQSEPHLFMFNDNIYKYRPCESTEKASNDALNENYQSSLPPYQSIDLKFPTEDSTPKLCAWNKLKTRSYMEVQDNSFLKDDTSNSSCSCSESEIQGLNKQMFKLFKERLTCIHSEKVPKYSIGLQVETDKVTQGTQVVIDDTCLQYDLCGNNLLLELKDNLIKAKNKAEEKGILIEQLQSHLTSAVKEVELKDKVLGNVEKKLQNSRDECSNLKNQIGDLNSEIQLILKDLEDNRLINANLKLQVEQQGQIIRTLQEALVQSKRAFDAAHPKMPMLQAESMQSRSQQTSKSSIVDI